MVIEAVKTRSKQPEIRKDQLLDAAQHLFKAKGFIETTVADIAEAAGVAKGTFYLYFPSKDHCVVALKERLCNSIIDRFLSVLAPAFERVARGESDLDIVATIRELLDQTFDYAVENADTYANLFHRGDTIEVDQVALAAEDQITLTLTQAFNQLNELGLTKVTHPAHTARILFSGINWAVDRLVCREKEVDVTDLKEAALEVSIRSLGLAYPPS